MSLAARVWQTYAGATYTTDLTGSDMWAGVQRVVEQMGVDEPGTPALVFPARVGVYHPGTVYTHVRYALQADIQPGGMYVGFTGGDDQGEMAAWLAGNGYASAGTPWATLTADGVDEVRWPVRPRDTDAFVARHGIRVGVEDPDGLVRDRQQDYLETQDGCGSLIERFARGSARPNDLAWVWREALGLARLAHLLAPDDVVRWLTLAARAGLAELTCRATGSPLPLELDGRQVEVTTGTGRLDRVDLVDTVMAALAVADPVALALLRDLPTVQAEEYVRTRVTALRALSRGDGSAHEAVRTVVESAQATTGDGYLAGWFTHMEVPVWRLATALLDGSDFTTAQRDALLAHRHWWAHTQANPGEPQDLDPRGYLSLGVTCFTALRQETGGDTVDSEYVPTAPTRPAWR